MYFIFEFLDWTDVYNEIMEFIDSLVKGVMSIPDPIRDTPTSKKRLIQIL